MKTLFLAMAMAAVFLAVGQSPVQADDDPGWAQITLQNGTSVTLDLYVDGNYGCRANSGMTCTTQVRPGVRDLSARASDGRGTATKADIARGTSPVWVVNEQPAK